jgi:tetratricopeptide (TPR) repeat protein
MKQMLRVVGAFVLVGMFAAQAHAQMGVARGKVVDANGDPLADVTVEIVFLGELERKYTTETGDDGNYMQVVGTGRYRIIASKEGYQGTYMDQMVRTGDPTDLPTLTLSTREAAIRKAMAPVFERFERAAELTAARKFDEALALYKEVEADYPQIPELHFNLGTLYTRQEKWPEAEAAFMKSLELEPDNPEARILLANVHNNMGRTEEAVAAMEKLIAEHSDDPKIHYDLGVFYLDAKRDEEAFAQFEEVRRLDPDNVDALYLLGTLSINLGQQKQAVEYLQSYLEGAPEDGRFRATANELLSRIQPAETQ